MVIGMLDPYRNNLDTYAKQNVTAFAMELLPHVVTGTKYGRIVLASQPYRL